MKRPSDHRALDDAWLAGVRRVLVLAAHPDDEMACSGTIARLTSGGAEVSIVTFSRCRDMIPPGFSVDDLESEWQAACDLLRVGERVLLDLPNRNFPALRQAVLDELDRWFPRDFQLVLVPSAVDAHQDHNTVATEAIRVFKRTTVLGYELPINAVVGPVPNVFVRLRPPDVEAKVAHVALYRTQASRPYMAEAFVRGLVAVRGLQCGAEAAEAFQAIRIVF